MVGILVVLAVPSASAQTDNDTCFMCHDDASFETERQGATKSLYVDPDAFLSSAHADLDCTDCHEDASEDHPERLAKVRCGDCHGDAQLDFDASAHGQALARKLPYAPDCRDCHGVHQIRPPGDPKSMVYKTNVPLTCGRCHREGAPVASTYDIGEHNILENYSQSIHGEGLFKKGLIVTASCNDCHSSHSILPHTDPLATISPRNIANTCMKCHSQIEAVHEQVIRGELWEEAPGAIPSCTDCHRPHRARKETVAMTVSDRECLRCHSKAELIGFTAAGDSLSMYVDAPQLKSSAHTTIPCVKCHSDIDPRLDRPCESSAAVDCSACHAKISDEYAISGHGTARAKGVSAAPYCTTCHGSHGTLPHSNENALSFRANVPGLCGECHAENGSASAAADLTETSAFNDYSRSVHGRGLSEKGLLPSAICIDCHSSHMTLPASDDRSRVYPKNLPATCAICHRGIYKDFIKSVHYSPDPKDEKLVPTCARCHSSHTINETGQDEFMHEVTEQCGSCHSELAETYLETMHGKAYQLGYLQSARCSDCHGAHKILANDDPESSVGFRNIVTTCQKCHEDANARFTGYLTHATHHDPDRYPWLYYTYWAMTSLLVGVFSFFGIHTLMWLPKSFRNMRQRKREHKVGETRHYVRRFTRQQQYTHIFVILSFLSLALTGMMLKFSSMAWANWLSEALGGVRNAGLVHRGAALMTFGYFSYHLFSLISFKKRRKVPIKDLIFGPNALMFNGRDVREFVASVKWFWNKGPRPEYGRWTYWEKFDYLAVFWGIAVIGLSGLMLWFPEFFTKFLPGWLINVATIIHSDEALLAVGFIFTIHFFNTHLRPEAFPMDTVIFTGVVPYEEYKKDRPRAVSDLKASGELRRVMESTSISPRRMRAVKILGYTALTLGTLLIGLILYSVLFGYR
jgi:predicted CXXCH cytochrome family protein